MLDITVLVTLLLFCVSHIPFRREGELLVCKRVIPVVIPLCNRNRNYLFQLGTKNVNRWMCQMDSSLEYDYPGIDYPIPFNEVFNNVSMRYHDFGCVTCSPPFVNRGLIQPHSKGMDPYLFITGASDNHAAGSVNCLLSIALNYPNSSLLYVSFGSDRMTPLIMRLLSSIHLFHERIGSRAKIYYRKYDYSHFPNWMHINNITSSRGGYSWKIISVYDAFVEWSSTVIWMDGGNYINDTRVMDEAFHYSIANGFYSPMEPTTVGKKTHKSMIDFLEERRMISKHDLKWMSAAGGFLIVHQSSFIKKRLLPSLLFCIYTEACVSPINSTRKNHLQDQSAITLLVHDSGFKYCGNPQYSVHPVYRQEGWSNVMKNYLHLKREYWKLYKMNITLFDS